MKRYKNFQPLTQILVPGLVAIGSAVYVIHETYPTWTNTRGFFIELFVMASILGIAIWLGLWADKKEKEQKRLKKMKKKLAISRSQTNSYKSPLPGQIQ
jgi:hypothetical protein